MYSGKYFADNYWIAGWNGNRKDFASIVIVTVEVEGIMFGRNIDFPSFFVQLFIHGWIFIVCELGNVFQIKAYRYG